MIMTVQKEPKTKQKGNAWEKTAFCQYFRDPPKISQIVFSGELMSH